MDRILILQDAQASIKQLRYFKVLRYYRVQLTTSCQPLLYTATHNLRTSQLTDGPLHRPSSITEWTKGINFHRKATLEGSSVGKVLILQIQGPEFNPYGLCKKARCDDTHLSQHWGGRERQVELWGQLASSLTYWAPGQQGSRQHWTDTPGCPLASHVPHIHTHTHKKILGLFFWKNKKF